MSSSSCPHFLHLTSLLLPAVPSTAAKLSFLDSRYSFRNPPTSTRTVSAVAMAERPFGDLDNIRWTWVGRGTKRGKYRLFSQAKVERLNDNTSRIFTVGDTVYVANNDGGQAWVGHLIEMCEGGSLDAGGEVELVENSPADTQMRMFCRLRWFYNSDDETVANAQREARNSLPDPHRAEIYFSDHVEEPASNLLEVIEGKAFLVRSPKELREFRKNYPEDYWAGDEIRIARCMYGVDARAVPSLREFERGELDELLKCPSTDTHTFDQSRRRMYGPQGPVLKGTGRRPRHVDRKNAFGYEARSGNSSKRSWIVKEPRGQETEEVMAGQRRFVPDEDATPIRRGEVAAASNAVAFPRRRRMEGGPIRKEIEFSSSDDDFVPETLAPPERWPNPSPVAVEEARMDRARKKKLGRKKKKKGQHREHRMDSELRPLRAPVARQQPSAPMRPAAPLRAAIPRPQFKAPRLPGNAQVPRSKKAVPRSKPVVPRSKPLIPHLKPVVPRSEPVVVDVDEVVVLDDSPEPMMNYAGPASARNGMTRVVEGNRTTDAVRSPEVDDELQRVKDAFAKATVAEQDLFLERLPDLLRKMLQLMQENKMDCDMNQRARQKLAKAAMKKVFKGQLAPRVSASKTMAARRNVGGSDTTRVPPPGSNVGSAGKDVSNVASAFPLPRTVVGEFSPTNAFELNAPTAQIPVPDHLAVGPIAAPVVRRMDDAVPIEMDHVPVAESAEYLQGSPGDRVADDPSVHRVSRL